MIRTLFLSALAAAVSIGLSGCAPDAGPAPDSGTQAHDDEAEHAHGDEGEHAHAHEGPHDGCLIELEDGKYHAEMVHDDEAHSLTVYLLDAEGKGPAVADTPELTLQIMAGGQFVDYVLKAAPDAESNSCFVLADETLCRTLDDADGFRGRIHVTISGQTCSGDVDESAHEHEEDGHEHAEDGDDHEEDGDDHDEDGHEHAEDGDDHDEDGDDHDEDGDEHAEDGDDHEEDGHEHAEDGGGHDESAHEHEEDGHDHDEDGHHADEDGGGHDEDGREHDDESAHEHDEDGHDHAEEE